MLNQRISQCVLLKICSVKVELSKVLSHFTSVPARFSNESLTFRRFSRNLRAYKTLRLYLMPRNLSKILGNCVKHGKNTRNKFYRKMSTVFFENLAHWKLT